MATLSVIYRIASDISGLQEGVNRAASTVEKLEEHSRRNTETMDRWSSVAGSLGKALIGAFSITAVVNFGKEIAKTADQIQKLSDKTGIGVEGIQELKHVAEQSGNTLEQLTGAISKMQVLMASDDKKFLKTLEDLNINVRELKALEPQEQFFTLAKAVASIEDPAERAEAAVRLFGRAGAEILPSITADIEALRKSTAGMSEDAASVVDAARHSLESLGSLFDRFCALLHAVRVVLSSET